MFCPKCMKLVRVVAVTTVLVCSVCGGPVPGPGHDDLPHQLKGPGWLPTVTSMVSGSGGTSAPFVPSNDGSQELVVRMWHQRAEAHRAAVDASMQNQRSMGWIS